MSAQWLYVRLVVGCIAIIALLEEKLKVEELQNLCGLVCMVHKWKG